MSSLSTLKLQKALTSKRLTSFISMLVDRWIWHGTKTTLKKKHKKQLDTDGYVVSLAACAVPGNTN